MRRQGNQTAFWVAGYRFVLIELEGEVETRVTFPTGETHDMPPCETFNEACFRILQFLDDKEA